MMRLQKAELQTIRTAKQYVTLVLTPIISYWDFWPPFHRGGYSSFLLLHSQVTKLFGKRNVRRDKGTNKESDRTFVGGNGHENASETAFPCQ